MPTSKTGNDIDAFCTRCQLELAHVVVATVAGRPARVQCKTCGSVHAWRSKDMAPRRKAEPTTRPSAARGAGRSDYDALVRGRDISRAQRYRPAATYGDGDVLSHPTFGVGVVTRVLSDGKIEVLFPAASKVLVHARG